MLSCVLYDSYVTCIIIVTHVSYQEKSVGSGVEGKLGFILASNSMIINTVASWLYNNTHFC